MKFKHATVLFIFFSFFSVIYFCSCSDKCRKVICYNGAVCNDGTCICLAGYEGDDCGTETREKFLGTYNVTDNCNNGNAPYTANIAAAGDSINTVLIANFNNSFSNSIVATISANNIDIPLQIPDLDGRSVSGSGIFTGGNTIVWSYKITSSSQIISCTNSIWVR